MDKEGGDGVGICGKATVVVYIKAVRMDLEGFELVIAYLRVL